MPTNEYYLLPKLLTKFYYWISLKTLYCRGTLWWILLYPCERLLLWYFNVRKEWYINNFDYIKAKSLYTLTNDGWIKKGS